MDRMLNYFRKVDPDLNGRIAPEVSVRDQLETIGKLGMEMSGKMISHHGNEEWF